VEILHRETTLSTNEWAREHAASGGALPIALLADEQSAGRGQHGNIWDSPRGWTYLSVVLAARQEPATDLPLQVANVVCGVLTDRFDAETFRVKPPNDIYRVGSRDDDDDAAVGGADTKIAGILVEQTADCLVIGIGVDYPPEGLAESLVCALGNSVAESRII
jgi:BirA family biotin operon repressor/biotin-[acetyl-CoA-carboxylase] ligase